MKKIYALIILVAIVVTAYAIIKTVDSASPTFVQVNSTASATSTLTYLTAGTATTTLVYDSYKYNGTGEINGKQTFTLGVQFTGSSTASALAWRYEYSNNGNCEGDEDACDWYLGNINTNENATSTFYSLYQTHNLIHASSTMGTMTNAQDRMENIFEVPIMARYVRAVFYVPVGRGNGAFWAEAIGIKPRY